MTRRGWTLIEVVAAIAVGSVIMGLGIALLHLLLRLDRETREDLRARAALARLAEQFRDDAHGAVGPASTPPHPGPWRFPLRGDRVAEYVQEADGLTRVERAGNEDQRRESYRLPAGTAVSVEVEESKSGRMAVLRIVPGDKEPREPAAYSVRIEAALGLE
jgi:prepilin-type N-terminal cleavage/methylation domain-containing protein